ncbi:MAG: low molecular weight protein tyrosine phosphatase family protein [Stagnimonas sp.]|nr:low molecular weight protein tyrosine phosphatase family protein [Stagnimonas sp.]
MQAKPEVVSVAKKNVLFVCSQNKLRSPTAEHVFASHPGIAVTSAGTNHDAENPLTPELVEWADLIFVMEPVHRKKLTSKFRASIRDQQIVCLGIPDEFDFMEAALVSLLQRKVQPYLPTP